MSVLFLPTSGKGVGHVRRLHNIIVSLNSIDDTIPINLAVDNKISKYISDDYINLISLPPRITNLHQSIEYHNDGIDNKHYSPIIHELVAGLRCKIVVSDFVVSDSLFTLVKEYGGKNVLILRNQKKEKLQKLFDSNLLDLIDKIIIPHESENFNLKGTAFENISINTGPIIAQKKHIAPSDIKRKFAISEEHIWVIATIGGGGYYSEQEKIVTAIKSAQKELIGNREVTFSIFSGCYGRKLPSPSRNIRIHDFDFDIHEYYAAADLVLAIPGYNSFHEILSSNSSVIFFPVNRTLDDQFSRVNNCHNVTNVEVCEDIQELPKILFEKIETIDRTHTRNAIPFVNGAVMAAKEIISLADTVGEANYIVNEDTAIIADNNKKQDFKNKFESLFNEGIRRYYFTPDFLRYSDQGAIYSVEEELKKLNIDFDFKLIPRLTRPINGLEKNRLLSHINLRITQKCNSKCVYCWHWRVKTDTPHMPLKKVLDTAYQAKQLGAESIVLNGGEPTLHPDFHDITRLINKLGLTITINTNGRRLLEKSFFKKICAAEYLNLMITVLSVNDVGLRGIPDWGKEVIERSHLLKEKGFKGNIRANIVLNKKNFSQLLTLVDRLIRARVDQITINLTDSVLEIDNKSLKLDESEIVELYFKILPKILYKTFRKRIHLKINPYFIEICHKISTDRNYSKLHEIVDLFIKKSDFHDEVINFSAGEYGRKYYETVKFCSIPYENIYVMSNGDAYPCLRAIGANSIRPSGNLYFRQMKAIIQSNSWRNFQHDSGAKDLCYTCNNAFNLNLKRIINQ